jgi:hypothetical protein
MFLTMGTPFKNKFSKTVLKGIPVLVLLFSLLTATAQNYSLGSRSAALGNSSVTLRDIWSIHHNQAGLAYLEVPSAGFHFENRFLVPELGLRAGVFGYPTKYGTFGLCVSYFGYRQYNESKFGLAYALRLGKVLSAGIQIDYLNTFFEAEYGNKGTVIGEIGLLAEPVRHLYIGAHLFNPTRSKIADYNDEREPTILRIGMGYHFADKVYVAAEAEKDLDFATTFKGGLEYRFLKNLFLRAGVSSNPAQPSFGIGYVLKGFKADIAFSSHPNLGITPHFSLTYQFASPNKSSESSL